MSAPRSISSHRQVAAQASGLPNVLYRQLLMAIDDGFCIVEMIADASGAPVDYRFVETNPAFERQTGLTDAIGRTALELVPGLEPFWIETYGRVARSGRPERFVSGSESMQRWFEVHATRVDAPEVQRVAIVFKDISERRRAEAASLESEARFRQLADNAPMHIWMADPAANLTYANQALLRFVGLTMDEFAGHRWESVVHPDDVEAVRNVYLAAVRKRKPYTLQLRYREAVTGAFQWHLVQGVPHHVAGEFVGFIGSGFNVHDREEAHKLIRVSEARYRQLADAMPQLVWTCGPDGEVDYYNSRLADFVETQSTDGRWRWQPLLHPDDVAGTAAAWGASMKTGASYEFEHRLRMRDGRYRWHLSRARATREDDGSVSRWFGTATDIDGSKRHELNAQFLLELDASLNQLSAAAAIEQLAVDRLGEYLDVDHCSFASVRDGTLTIAREFRRGGPSYVNAHRVSDFLPPELGSLLQGRQVLVVADALGDARLTGTAASYAALSIRGLMVAPVSYREQWIGNLHVASAVPRRWQAHEVQLLRDVAARVWPLLERARTVEELERESEQLQLVSDTVPALISYVDRDYRYRWCNRAYESWFSRPAADVVGRPMSAILGDQAWRTVGPRVSAAMDGETVEYEAEIPYVAGGTRWIHAVYTPHRSADRQVLGVVVMVNDITERKRAESDALLLADLGERIRRATTAEQLLGGIATLIGKYFALQRCFFAEKLDGDDRCVVRDDYHAPLPSLAGLHRLSAYSAQLIDEARAARVVFVSDTTADARTAASRAHLEALGIRALVMVPMRQDGRSAAILMACAQAPRTWQPREISLLEAVAERTWNAVEKLRLDAELKESEKKFFLLFQKAAFGTMLSLPSGVLVDVNESFVRMFGYSRDEAVGKTSLELGINPDAQIQQRILAQIEQQGSVHDIELPLLTRSGERRFFLNNITVIEFGGRKYFLTTLQDITERTRAEQALIEADRRKDEFLATLAHELRNPMAPLRSALTIVQKSRGNPARFDDACEVMQRQLTHMVRLVDDLLDVGRIASGKLEVRTEALLLSTILEQAVEASRPLIDAEEHQLVLTAPDEPLYVLADLTRLAQVFSNLLNNATKYTERGGRIDVIVRRSAGQVEVSIKDNGVGIPPAMLPKVFDLFTQVDRSLERSHGGLGVGLSLVRRLVELHGGFVEAKSSGAGHGSEFVVQLPLAEPPAADPTRPLGRIDTQGALPNRRIMVVDDNRDAAESLAAVLELMGNDTRVAHDGLEALKLADEFLPEVMLLDIGMPRMNGYDVARAMRARPQGADVLLVALTGWSQDVDKKQSKEAGFDLHLTKPADPDVLQQLLAAQRAT